MKVGVDISPLVQTRAGTARHVNGLLGALAGRDVELTPLSFGGTGRAATVARDTWWYSAACRARRAGSTCSTARPSARRSARRFRHGDGARPRARAPSRRSSRAGPALRPRRDRPRRARSRPRARRLRVHEAGGGRAARRARGARDGDPNARRAGLLARRAGAPRATTCSRSARSSRARTSRRVVEATSRAGVGAARRRRAWLGRRRRAPAGSAGSRTRSSPRSTAARAASSSRRSTRASASRCSRRWPAARPSSRAPAARWRRSSATLPCSSTRSTSPRSPPGSRRRPAARRARPARPGACSAYTWERAVDAAVALVPASARMTTPLVVVDADVLGRRRTGDETYVRNLLRELGSLAPEAGLRIAAVTRHPELVPDGIEPLALRTPVQELRMAPDPAAAAAPARRRARATSQYAVPLRCRARPWSRSTISRSSASRHDGRKDRLVFRASSRGPRGAARRVLTVSERTRAISSALRAPRGEGRRDPERRRPRVLARERPAASALRARSSGRCSRGRTSWRRSPPPRRSDCRSSSPAP